jgi:hypothetical protein
MVSGNFEGRKISDPVVRNMFTLEAMLASEWYSDRLRRRQQREQDLWQRHLQALETFQNSNEYAEEKIAMKINDRLESARLQLAKVLAPEYLSELHGTLGTDAL